MKKIHKKKTTKILELFISFCNYYSCYIHAASLWSRQWCFLAFCSHIYYIHIFICRWEKKLLRIEMEAWIIEAIQSSRTKTMAHEKCMCKAVRRRYKRWVAFTINYLNNKWTTSPPPLPPATLTHSPMKQWNGNIYPAAVAANTSSQLSLLLYLAVLFSYCSFIFHITRRERLYIEEWKSCRFIYIFHKYSLCRGVVRGGGGEMKINERRQGDIAQIAQVLGGV